MGSITTNGFSVANLVQNLTGAGSPQLAATLSSPAVQTAIQNAPASDIPAGQQVPSVAPQFGDIGTGATLPVTPPVTATEGESK